MNRQLRPGTLVVLEGLDKAGKSTQRDLLASMPWADPRPESVHMPSGRSPVTQSIYELLEERSIGDALAVQLLHLACHAEAIPWIQEALATRAVILDRWWWSTVAYGWYGAGLDERLGTRFLDTVQMVWSDVTPNAVVLFLDPFEDDSANSAPVSRGYDSLASESGCQVIRVPVLARDETTNFIVSELERIGLVDHL